MQVVDVSEVHAARVEYKVSQLVLILFAVYPWVPVNPLSVVVVSRPCS